MRQHSVPNSAVLLSLDTDFHALEAGATETEDALVYGTPELEALTLREERAHEERRAACSRGLRAAGQE